MLEDGAIDNTVDVPSNVKSPSDAFPYIGSTDMVKDARRFAEVRPSSAAIAAKERFIRLKPNLDLFDITS